MTDTTGITRREAVALSAVAAASVLLPSAADSQPAAPMRVRPEARSAEGRQMLELYRLGVQRMRATPEWNPRGWNFQANMHSIHPSNRLPGEADRIFDPNQTTDPAERQAILAARALALGEGGQPRLWGGCKHGHPHFLSWHRWFLFFFERIVESHLQDVLSTRTFALPYWEYTSDSIPDARILPPEFRLPELPDETPNALFYRFRNPCISRIANPAALDGADIDINLAFISRITLATETNPIAFSPLLEGTPHGSVHVALGNTVDGDAGMSRVPFAARDPIFWLHHANIDRLWEFWRRSPIPPTDPTGDWLAEKFNFAGPDGKLAPPVTAGETLNLDAFGYTYPDLPPRPAVVAQAPPAPAAAAVAPAPRVIATTPPDAAGRLSTSSTSVRVRSVTGPTGTGPAAAAAVTPGGRVFLQIEGIELADDPATNFDVFVRPVGAAARAPVRVGRFSVFGVAQSEQADAAHAHGGVTRLIDITDAARGNAAFVLGSPEFEVVIRAANGHTRAPLAFRSIRVLMR
jgi:tyrosinase